MKKWIGFFLVVMVGCQLLTMQSCTKDNVQDYYPVNNTIDSLACANATITYSLDVVSVLTDYCLLCHSTAQHNNLGSGILLEGYNALKVYADNGKLLCSIKHSGACESMPQGSSKIPDTEIAKIETWINEGVCNN